jgi:hypothetical protein
MLAGSERLEKLNLYSADHDATFSGENATEPAGRTNQGQTGAEYSRRGGGERGQAVVNDQARVRNWTHLPPLAAWT